MEQEGIGITERWNQRQLEKAAAENAGLDDLLQRELLALSNGNDSVVEECQGEASKSATANKSTSLTSKVINALEKVNYARAAPARFPVTDVGALPIVVDALGRLEALMDELRQHGDYRHVRDEYCQLSILLNLQSAIAPAYRPLPKPGKSKGDPVFFEIHRDQLVIDCHWLHAKKLTFKAKDDDLQRMFTGSRPFPFDVAWAFASKNWKKTYRANEALSLTLFQQCQLVALRGEVISERFTAAMKGVRGAGGRVPAKISAVKQALSEWCERDRRVIPNYEDYERLWLAREMLGADAPIRKIAELFASMTGEKPRDDKTIRSKLEKMDRHIGGV